MVNRPVEIQGFPFKRYPLNNITPFSYRDGHTFLENIESVRRELADLLENDILQNTSINDFVIKVNETLADLMSKLVGYTIDVTEDQYVASMMDGTTFAAYTIEGIDKIIATVNQTLDTLRTDTATSLYNWNKRCEITSVSATAMSIRDNNSELQATVPTFAHMTNEDRRRMVFASDYGVDPTGATITGDQLQLALNAARNCILVIEAGTYLINKTLHLPANSVIRGVGRPIIKRQDGFSGTMAANYPEGGDNSTSAYNGFSNIYVDGIIFDGNSAPSAGNMVSIAHAKNINFSNCDFWSCTGYHHLEINSTWGATVHRCTFLGHIPLAELGYRREAIQIDCSNTGSVGSGVRDGYPARDVVVSECTFDKDSRGNRGPMVCVGSHTDAANGSDYANITVRDCVARDVGVAFAWFTKAFEVHIENNRVSMSTAWDDTLTFRRGIAIANSQRYRIVNNVIIMNEMSNCFGIDIRNESNRGVCSGNMTQHGSFGINIVTSHGNNVNGNIVMWNNSYGIVVNSATRNHIDGNIVDQRAGANSPPTAIRLNGADGGSSIYNSVCNNSLYSDAGVTAITNDSKALHTWITGNRSVGFADFLVPDVNGVAVGVNHKG